MPAMRHPLNLVLCLVALLALLATGQAQAQSSGLGPYDGPNITVDVGSGRVLSANRAFDAWYPASTTKLMTAYVVFQAVREGRVTLANALGNGVADDKSVYPYVADMIRFYLGEEPIIGNVPTWNLRDEDDRGHVLDTLPELVVKEVRGSGGYGMLVGPTSTRDEIEAYRARILEDPSNFIAQPTLALSTCPTFVETGVAPRHVDLRPFVLAGERVTMVPGAFTRVALREGSLVVNSSQGGGTKDTWVLS